MAGLLDIPPELFLLICTDLGQREFSQLSMVSRLAYLTTQSLLYHQVTISTYASLIKLVRTLGESPVFTDLDESCPPSQLKSGPQERTIAYLNVGNEPTGRDSQSSYNLYHLAQLLTAIARKCRKIAITLRLTNRDVDPIIGLPYIIVPRVCKVIVSAHPKDYTIEGGDYWTYFLGGHVFPDLCSLETKGFPHLPGEQPLSLEQQMILARDSSMRRLRAPDIRSQVMFKRLEFLRSLRIEGDVTLNPPSPHSLLRSAQAPVHLTTLEIVHCHRGFFEASITDIQQVLQRCLTELPELRKLKFHTIDHTIPWPQGPQNPSLRCCIFAPHNPTRSRARDFRQALGPPTIAHEPQETLPQRLINQGFKYRRLIRWVEMCDGWDDPPKDWELITASASTQGEEYSWEIVNVADDVASWHVGGHDTVHFSADHVLKQPR